jgi:hypothetical protein
MPKAAWHAHAALQVPDSPRWLEAGSTKPLRVHISKDHSRAGPAGGRTLTDASAVSLVVKDWLDGVLLNHASRAKTPSIHHGANRSPASDAALFGKPSAGRSGLAEQVPPEPDAGAIDELDQIETELRVLRHGMVLEIETGSELAVRRTKRRVTLAGTRIGRPFIHWHSGTTVFAQAAPEIAAADPIPA